MSDFIASNGAEISEDSSGGLKLEWNAFWLVEDLREFWVDALREYFQAERDRELGRWRDPVNPDYVVYPDVHRLYISQPAIIVINEKTGGVADCSEDGSVSSYGVGAKDSENWLVTAERYFEAHPEKKPWHSAEPGEVWMVRTGDEGMPYAPEIVQELSWSKQMHFVRGYERATRVDSWNIQDAYRIWPEEGEGQ